VGRPVPNRWRAQKVDAWRLPEPRPRCGSETGSGSPRRHCGRQKIPRRSKRPPEPPRRPTARHRSIASIASLGCSSSGMQNRKRAIGGRQSGCSPKKSPYDGRACVSRKLRGLKFTRCLTRSLIEARRFEQTASSRNFAKCAARRFPEGSSIGARARGLHGRPLRRNAIVS
jgi:hypothetical protein